MSALDLTTLRERIHTEVCNYGAQLETAGEADAHHHTPEAERLEALAAGTKERILATVDELTAEVERLREALAKADRNVAFWKGTYDAVQEVLDGTLGTEETDGAGEGIAADVLLLAQQRDEARAKLAAAQDRPWTGERSGS